MRPIAAIQLPQTRTAIRRQPPDEDPRKTTINAMLNVMAA
jgi:hypothetical protein